MEAKTVERKWQMTRLEAGDYLLPSNDTETLWRISTYEDGPSHGLIDWPKDRTLWGAWRWVGHGDAPESVDDLADWGLWEQRVDMCATRQEAIDAALTWKPPQRRAATFRPAGRGIGAALIT